MAIAKWMGFGAPQGAQQSAAGSVDSSKAVAITKADYKQFGLENFGNTCYANSVLQALYFCDPFRELVTHVPDSSNPTSPTPSVPLPNAAASTSSQAPARIKNVRKPSTNDTRVIPDTSLTNGTTTGPPIPPAPPTLFSALRALFVHISHNSLDKGTVSPRAFVDKLKKENELFRSSMHQDAHEFLNYLLNKVAEDLEEEAKNRSRNSSGEDLSTSSGPSTSSTGISNGLAVHATLVHKLFEGILTSETRCLTCETVSSRDEAFLDLSIDIEQNSSVTACLRQFSASEMLCQRNKFFCDSCCGLQEAEKRMKIKRLPNILALHLKRFKYQEDVQRYIKLTYRVAFPLELRLFNTVDDAQDPDRLYELFAIVVHIGNGPHHGHYVSIVKSRGSWVIFDDDAVDTIKESDIPKYFGDSNSGSAYVLYYQAVDLDLAALGLRTLEPVVESPPESPPAPDLPPGLAPEGDSDIGEISPISPINGALPTTKVVPAPLTVSIPPSETSLAEAPTAAPSNASSPSVAKFFTLRHSPSTKTFGSISARPSSNATSPPPVPALPSFSPPKLQNDVSEASTSSNVPLVNGKVKPQKEKSSGWLLKRRSTKVDKAEKADKTPVIDISAAAADVKVRSDDASTSSSSSRRRPKPDTSPQLRPTEPPRDLGRRSIASVSSQDDSVASRSFAPSPPAIATSPPTSPSSSSSHNFTAPLHLPDRKHSFNTLSTSAPAAQSFTRVLQRPSTFAATLSPPARKTFSSIGESLAAADHPDEAGVHKTADSEDTFDDDGVHRRNSLNLSQQIPANGTVKRPPRKMSFTGGMLGFVRKDKDRHKEKEKGKDGSGTIIK